MSASLFGTIVSCIDLTSLTESETEASILDLAQKADDGIQQFRVAAVCTYPQFAATLRRVHVPGIKLAVVAPGFPSGIFSEEEVKNFTSNCNLADEIDVVIDPKLAQNDSWSEYAKAISFWRKQIAGKTMKVIIESGELTASQVERATAVVAESGADFVKTSTGKTNIGFTKEALIIICRVVKNHFEKTGKRIGIKVSGGIKTYDQAVEITGIISENLGNDWLVPATFRIGASSLYDTLKNHGGHK